jgi:CDP-diacylglycerol---serine O-phosphatidyltransferase
MNSKYRYLVPNGVTFASLACGVIAILLAVTGNLRPAAMLILVSYVLDLLDGMLARRLRAGSEFGLQLDSLVDMVSLGVAPATVLFAHLRSSGVEMVWVWPLAVLFPFAGAFRLARFNLLPPKTSGGSDSVGLTISTGGATLALAVLAADIFPPIACLPLTLIVCALMVSTIAFPSFFWVFSGRRRSALLLALFGISLLITSFFNAWFLWTNAYLGVSLARAGYKTLRTA